MNTLWHAIRVWRPLFGRAITTLYIDDSRIQVTTSIGKKVTKWAEASPGIELSKVATPDNHLEAARRIKELLSSVRAGTTNIVVGISGLHSMVRTVSLPQVPKEALEEAVTREAKRVLSVAMEEIYIAWQTSAQSKGRETVLLVATPRKVVDSLVDILRHAGIKPSVIELKPLALSRLMTVKTAALIDIERREFDIVIVREGVPQMVRTVTFPALGSR